MSTVHARANAELGARATSTTDALLALGNLLVADGRIAEAEALYLRGIAARSASSHRANGDATAIRIDYVKLLVANNRIPEAVAIAREVLAAQRARPGNTAQSVRDAQLTLAHLLLMNGAPVEAESHARAALSALEQENARFMSALRPSTELLLASILARQGRTAQAIELVRRAQDHCARLPVSKASCEQATNFAFAQLQINSDDSAAEADALRAVLAASEAAPETQGSVASVFVRTRLVRMRIWQGDFDGAAADLEAADARARAQGDALQQQLLAANRAALAVEQVAPDDAQRAFDATLARPGAPPLQAEASVVAALAVIAHEFVQRARPGRAAPFHQRARELLPHMAASTTPAERQVVLYTMAVLAIELRLHDEAAGYARELVAETTAPSEPSYAPARLTLFLALTAGGHMDEAKAMCAALQLPATDDPSVRSLSAACSRIAVTEASADTPAP